MAARKQTTPSTTPLTAGSNIRMETPSGDRRRKAERPTIVVQEINPARGFVGWLRENAVVGLAVGFVVGAQVQVVVKQLINSFIDPLSVLIFGTALSAKAFTLTWHGRTASFTWGAFVYGLIIFLFTLLVIFMIIKFLKLDKLDKPKEKK